MNLHNNSKLFSDTIRATSQHLNVIPVFIEKDYWITLVLSKLANSKYATSIVFKGGTSLSKGYNLINRFSEDVDIAIIDANIQSGNQIKTLIRDIEKEITQELTELHIDGLSSKGSRFRKSVFEYHSINSKNSSNKLIIEINSFANPYPFTALPIESFIANFLKQAEKGDYIQQYNLQSFHLNVLDKRQTLLEKLVSLIRFSYDKNVIQSLSFKIRHFYDLYFLLSDTACAEFIKTDDFKIQFNNILKHDKEAFDIPLGWSEKMVADSPLIVDFTTIWYQIKDTYIKELSALAFTEIPSEKEISEQFQKLIKMIRIVHE